MLTPEQAENLIFDSYNRVGAALHGFDQHTRDLKPMRAVFEQARIPRAFAPAIIVTGSKGKGSTSLLCAAILHGLGYRVGLFTSPHFRSIRERIRVDGAEIPEEAFTRIVTELQPAIEAVSARLPPGKYLGPTGLFLACALRYFEECGANALVLEVGRGGRFDDVSLVDNARIIAFTPIMGEHLDKLGPTVADVAWHKGGLIRPGAVPVSTDQTPDVMAVLNQIAASAGVSVHTAPRAVRLDRRNAAPDAVTQHFAAHLLGQQRTFTLHTPAVYQGENLALAVASVSEFISALVPRAAHSTGGVDQVVERLARLRLAGRCDVVQLAPLVIVDGAINGQSAAAFRESVQGFAARPRVLVAALPHDKDPDGYFAALGPVADQVIITQVSARHLTFDGHPARAAARYSAHVTEQPDVRAAFDGAVQAAGPEGCVWVAGTQSLVRDALTYWEVDLTSIYGAAQSEYFE